MNTITLEQAKSLKRGTILLHIEYLNADGSPQRWKVSGKPKTWKRSPLKVSVPIKRGLRQYKYLTEYNMDQFTL